MHEILFRGKDTETGEWRYSTTIARHAYNDTEIFSYYIGSGNKTIDGKTLGQYSGLTDRNGKKIFEGDIVQAHFRNNHSKQKFCVVFDDGMFLFGNNCVKVPKYDIYAMKVIGNIHDNPKLLGGADNGE